MILDTFPYPGGTTTCESLWMGVPTLTLAGNTMLARQGADLLQTAGLDEWIALSEEEYILKACALSSDLPRLAILRQTLRDSILASPLCDSARFARNLEAALWGMWQHRHA
jgi:predicted O-linked N-acetylglucosamine transferase (SPINDLY family)